LETLVCYRFKRFPGVRYVRSDARDMHGSEEIDLLLWNDRLPGSGLDFLPHVLLFECKNWVHPVNSEAVVYFTNKVRTRHLEYGFLIASSGVTGEAADLTAAYQHLHNALVADNVKIIVISRVELLTLTSTEQLKYLIQQKIAELILRS
jgi:hypothetical protein